MQQELRLSTSAAVAANEQLLKEEIADALSLSPEKKFFFRLLKRSVDARGRSIKINLTLKIFIDEIPEEEDFSMFYKDVEGKQSAVIIGAGPAGLFAALRFLESGIKPIIIERGKTVKDRRRDLAAINKDHIVNPESNYCFGEGGAGTYSDGKLYTRSNKRGDINRILRIFIFHGASSEIMVDAHPHIGTNKLPGIIEKMRETILKHGGEILFEHKLTDLEIENKEISVIEILDLKNGETKKISTKNLILATGHSARDIYELLQKKNIFIEAKPFAMGVRIEHPQEIIDSAQYHCRTKEETEKIRELLPASSYSMVHQVKGKGVYSFCMCPGGIIAPCATAQQEVVTNGWSPSKRNNPYANSGIVVGLDLNDFKKFEKEKALSGLRFQQELEKNAWINGGKTQTAPAQRLVDFVNKKHSNSLPDCSYLPGITSVQLQNVLGDLIADSLREGLKEFGKKMRGYYTNEAVLVGVESRTSTPVRIPRDAETCEHVEIKGLYPCGEGAGYAGGIVSAAMDGERVAEKIIQKNLF
ncbi:MAG: FAD-binding protein [Bacteroidia bacterium]|nr:FAD-binding protein [Bacteroidia bacterium]